MSTTGWLFRLGPGLYELGGRGSDPDRSHAIVGIGPAALVAAATASHLGRSMCFVRDAKKRYGSERQIEGDLPGRRRVHAYVTHRSDVDLLISIGMDVASCEMVQVRAGAGTTAVERSRPPYQQVEDLRTATDILRDGPYTRSSGEQASYYVETLTAAYSYDVAATYADSILDTGHEVVAGVAWGGTFLAATFASRLGRRLVLVDPAVTDDCPSDAFRGRDVLLVDDLVNRGAAIRRCRGTLSCHGADTVDAAALYAFAAHDTETSDVDVIGAVLDAPASETSHADMTMGGQSPS